MSSPEIDLIGDRCAFQLFSFNKAISRDKYQQPYAFNIALTEAMGAAWNSGGGVHFNLDGVPVGREWAWALANSQETEVFPPPSEDIKRTAIGLKLIMSSTDICTRVRFYRNDGMPNGLQMYGVTNSTICSQASPNGSTTE